MTANPYLLTGEELARAEAQRKSGRSIMTAKTATPMTDAAIIQKGDILKHGDPTCVGGYYLKMPDRVSADFARKLETDRARLIEVLGDIVNADNSTRLMHMVKARSLLRELEGK